MKHAAPGVFKGETASTGPEILGEYYVQLVYTRQGFLPDGQYSLVPGEISKGVQFKASGRGEELQKILARKTIVGCTLVRVGGGC